MGCLDVFCKALDGIPYLRMDLMGQIYLLAWFLSKALFFDDTPMIGPDQIYLQFDMSFDLVFCIQYSISSFSSFEPFIVRYWTWTFTQSS